MARPTRLGRLAMQRTTDTAVRVPRRRGAGLVDQAGAYTDLAESYLKSGKRRGAQQVLAALEIAPATNAQTCRHRGGKMNDGVVRRSTRRSSSDPSCSR
jgi:hypothetical protein